MKQIVLAANSDCALELESMGFRLQKCWVKEGGGLSTPENKQKLESELFRMKAKPFYFLVSDGWGMGPDN